MMRLIFIACCMFCLMPAIQTVDASNSGTESTRSTDDPAIPAVAGKAAVATPDKAKTGAVKGGGKNDTVIQTSVDAAQQKALAKPALEDSAATGSAEKSFNMNALIERIKESHAIGVFTKLALRSDALDLVDLFKAYRQKANHITLAELRARFDGLLLKALALLDDDPTLSHDISMAREGIWNSLLEVKA
jgi:hypothetical protein